MTANHAHTPTREQFKALLARIPAKYGEVIAHTAVLDDFDRMIDQTIAAAEQRGAIKALRDAEKVIDDELQDSPAPNHEEDNYDAGRIDGLTFSQEHLRDRADQVEGDGD